MDLLQISYFLELSRELHFWNTSEKVSITQSALSRHIKALEEELGIKLFDRDKRNVSLTPAGEFLAGEWSRLLGEINSIHRYAGKIQQGVVGEIRIGYLGSIANSYLPDLIKRIQVKLPDVRIELQEPVDIYLEDQLLNYRLDLGFRRQPAESPLLDTHLINSENFALVVPESHEITAENFRNLNKLRNEKFILSPLENKTLYVRAIWDIFKSYDFTPETMIETDYGATILSLVSRGLGVSIMPESYKHSQFPGVRFIPIPHKTSLYVVWRKDDTSPVVKNVLEIIKENS
jgi:DNA-binding transcriptional LysR family regulator